MTKGKLFSFVIFNTVYIFFMCNVGYCLERNEFQMSDYIFRLKIYFESMRPLSPMKMSFCLSFYPAFLYFL